MMGPADLRAVVEATWPAATVARQGSWLIRDGKGGGKRVSAASAAPGWRQKDLPLAEAAMADLGQRPLFVLYPGEEEVDRMLDAAGYRVIDPVVAYAAPMHKLTTPPDHMTTFPHWPPLAIAAELWAESGIGAERLAVMERAQGPKVVLLSRTKDRASGVAFVALHEKTAMLHALEVTPNLRRQGSAHNILRAAAVWAQQNGADTLSLVVTCANADARRLYASFGMSVVGQYHYRER